MMNTNNCKSKYDCTKAADGPQQRMPDYPEVCVGGGAEGVVGLVTEGGAVAGEAAVPLGDVHGQLLGV